MEKILTEHARQIVDTTDLLDLISYRNPQHNILNLRNVVGDEKYAMLLETFAGSYTRFPTTKNSLEAVDDIILVHLWDALESVKDQSLAKWNEAEARFIRHAQKIGMDYRSAQRRARSVTKELAIARNWANQHEQKRGQQPGE